MEAGLANTFVTDDFGSSQTANEGLGGGPEHVHGASQTTLYSPPPRVLVSSDEATLAFGREGVQVDEVDSTFLPPNNNESSQALAAHVTGNPEFSQDDDVDPVRNVECPPTASRSPWQPAYLRGRILAAFSVVFVLMIAVLELLSILSARNDGIAKGYNQDHYLWTYGPTALLTLTAALFNRVEYQAKLMAPWERLSKHPAPASTTLLLDYISPLQPVAVFESLKNKDFAVAATTTVSLLIKVMIVLSSGLITLSRVAVHHATLPMEVQSAFVDDESRLRAGYTLPYYVMQGLIDGSGYPPGILDEFAFQSVRSNLLNTAQYQVMVDGLTMNMHCEIADMDMAFIRPNEDSSMVLKELIIKSPGCEVNITNWYGLLNTHHLEEQVQHASGTIEPVQCHGTRDDADKRVLVMFQLEEWLMRNTSSSCPQNGCFVSGRLLNSAQLLCTPKYEIDKVNVVQNGTEVRSVKPAHPRHGGPLNRTLEHVSQWSFMEAYFAAFPNFLTLGEFNVSQEPFEVDRYIRSLLASQIPPDADMSLLYNPNFVQSIVGTYFQKFGAIIAKQLLMHPTSVNTTGSAMIMQDRLVVRQWAAQWMAGLVSICLILSLFTAFIIPRHGILHQSPNALLGIAVLVAHSPDLLERLCYSGNAISKTLRHQLEGIKR
ncbi:hypothetical protein diail_3373 [Diaporthe ilicicola]|nr:hypothetical protein diail_3373 [Diaporthe ilicicola]